MTQDPFPRDRIAAMVRRMPAYLRLSWRLGKDPLLSKARRAAVIGAAGYLASPVDLVPGVIPVLGQLDDIILIPLGVTLAMRMVPEAQWQARMREAEAHAERLPKLWWGALLIALFWIALIGLVVWGIVVLAS